MILIMEVREKGRNFIKKSRNFMDNRELTAEEIKKIEKAIQCIFAPIKRVMSVSPSNVRIKSDVRERRSYDLLIMVEGGAAPIFAVAKAESLIKNTWDVANQLCDIWKIGKENPIHDLLWNGKSPRYDKIKELLKTIK